MINPKLSKKVEELIKTATPKQKAILVVTDWTDRQKVRKEPLLTENEVRAIQNSLTPQEGKEYNKWIRCYNVYAEIAPIIGLAIAQYREQAEEIVGYLRTIEAYEQEENHLNTIYEALKDSKSKTALSAFDKSLKVLRFQFAELTRDEEGYIEINREKLFEIVRAKIKSMGFAYTCLKAFIIAIDKWTDKHKSKKLMPPALSAPLDEIRTDTAINVAPSYSRKYLKDRIAQAQRRGETYTPSVSESKKAIFPCYDDVPSDTEFIEIWTNKLNSIENSLKNG